jgi:Flp pilus assembly protein TadD
MRDYFQLTEKKKEVLGHVTVTVLLLVALIATSGCGRDAPSTRTAVGGGGTPTTPAQVQQRVAATATTEQEPETEPQPENIDTVPEITGPVTFDEARQVFDQGRFQEATILFESYSEEKPTNPWGHYMVGLSALKSGEYEVAEHAFLTVLELDSTHVKGLRNLARVYLETERPQDAISVLDRAVTVDSVSGETHRLLGRAYGRLGDEDRSIDEYHRAIVLDDEDAWSMNNLGLTLIRLERFEEALGPLARAVELRTDQAAFYNNLGIALERSGHFSLAAEEYRTALELDNEYGKAQVSLARVDGKPDRSGVTPVELTVLAQEFVEEVDKWRTDRGADEVVGDEPIDLPEIQVPVVEPTNPDAKVGGDVKPVGQAQAI